MLRLPSAFRFLLVTCLLALATSAHALTVRCVGNVAQLSAALIEANASTDTTFIIRVRTGTYDAAQAPAKFDFYADNPDQVIELSGGWTGSGSTCQTKGFDPSLTVLLGTATRTALTVGTASAGNAASTAYVNDVTLRNPSYTGDDVACLRGSVPKGEVRTERLHLEQCMAQSGVGAASFNNSGGLLTMRNVSVRDSAGRDVGGIFVTASAGSGISRLSQVSITTTQSYRSTAFAAGLHIQNNPTALASVSNTVVWGNGSSGSTADIYVNSNSIHFSRVHYGTINGTPTTNNTPSTGDPGFIAVGNARLRPDSILIDSGLSNPLGGSGTYDADGTARVKGPAIDVGAFEATPVTDTIFGNCFD